MAPVMGHHHRDEVSVHIVGGLDLHGSHHEESEPHHRDLLLLSDDDFLGEEAKQFVVSITQLGFCQVDGALVMGHHHRDFVAIHVVGGFDLHGSIALS